MVAEDGRSVSPPSWVQAQVEAGPASPGHPLAGKAELRSLLMMDKDVRTLSQATRADN